MPAAGPAPGPECPDVVIVGGGPAGCAAAIVLAELGWAVTLLEKAQHPRFHIGESLLPMNMPILERLGVLEQVRRIGVLKRGADFPNDAGGYNTFRFSHALDAKADFAFQVPRAQFDEVLFARARAVGVDAREQVAVEQVDLDGEQPLLRARTADGQVQQFRPRYLLDASGRDTFLGNRLKLKRANAKHQSAALFSHFRGVTRRPGEDAGNISIYRHAHGWMWLIPLPDDIMSVGAVCYPEYMKTRKGDSEGFLMRTLALNAEVTERMAGAQRVAPVHATGNYAYACTRMAGPRWLMLGDAYTFVDPMFSSGVFLAMHSAERGAAMVDAALRTPQHEAMLQRALQRELNRGIDEFKWFIYRFTSPTMRSLFAQPQNVLQLEQAVVAMLAGDVFDSPKVRLRLRAFRAIYALTTLSMLPRAWHSWRQRRRQARLGFDGDTLHRDSQ
ncbi:NAD(P)/FAD-dependent oxidoreductase [Xanthomonas sp. NCPPB 1638]|uniref:NAD(P)/FAD-dependent oxidoreductase n=1 Tax=Xanthomonas TaxID=338 RepID=UPI00132F4114|nr:FAD-dependent oxidoreductase [Xanthomonas cucurbitae]QHG88926.1 FAD-dependent oxidoreductase [Xanthomonas cucurbitae]WDM77217.1 FAD-dependent oxidoreductase [Xanthomonas cucurbitae]